MAKQGACANFFRGSSGCYPRRKFPVGSTRQGYKYVAPSSLQDFRPGVWGWGGKGDVPKKVRNLYGEIA